jgi:hypothetical protein
MDCCHNKVFHEGFHAKQAQPSESQKRLRNVIILPSLRVIFHRHQAKQSQTLKDRLLRL